MEDNLESIDQENLPETEREFPAPKGDIRISEDVIGALATQALLSVDGVRPASAGIVANLRLGRKGSSGVRISVSEGNPPVVQVDTFIIVKYGLRLPDVSWDVQESVKEQIERYTGYSVKEVNVTIQGIDFGEPKNPASPTESRQGEGENPGEFH
ncbi:MAG: Asp23/Gls24 family envelope stress response protein [Synergistales bacterium]|jgi:uncharacterized alkaline shock family protein YloU